MLSIFRNKPKMIQPVVESILHSPNVSPSSSEDLPFRKPLEFSFDEEKEDFHSKMVTKPEFSPKVEPEAFTSLQLSSKVELKDFGYSASLATFSQKVEYIHFHNATPFPLMIDTWIDTSQKSIKILPNYLALLHSSVGEWHMNTMFPDRKDRELWRQYKGLEKFTHIGKFRNKPCIQGNYVWMEYDKPFHCIYSEMKESKVKGLITFFWRKEELEK